MEPSRSRYRKQLVVPQEAIDELGHVSNLVYLEWALDVAREHSGVVGYSARKYVELGAAFVVKRHEIDYHRSAVEGDEVSVETWIESWSAASSIRRTEIVVGGKLACAVSTQWVFAALASGRPKRIPVEIREAFNAYVAVRSTMR